MLFVQFKIAHGSTGEGFLFNIPKCKDGLKLVGTMIETSALQVTEPLCQDVP